MSRYVNIEPYDDCKIVLHKEDVGIRCRELPTADVAEVKHGRWEVTKHKNHIIGACSCCGKEFYTRPYNVFGVHRIGNDVFLTHEEAEKALEGMK